MKNLTPDPSTNPTLTAMRAGFKAHVGRRVKVVRGTLRREGVLGAVVDAGIRVDLDDGTREYLGWRGPNGTVLRMRVV